VSLWNARKAARTLGTFWRGMDHGVTDSGNLRAGASCEKRHHSSPDRNDLRVGGVYGWLRLSSGSTVPPIAAHIAYNVVIFSAAALLGA